MNIKEYERRMSAVVERLRSKLAAGSGPTRAAKLAEQARSRVRRIAKEADRAVGGKALGRDQARGWPPQADDARVTLTKQVRAVEALHLEQIDDLHRPDI